MFVFTEAQRRALSVALRLVEERLRELEELTEEGSVQGALYTVIDDLTTDVREELYSFIQEGVRAIEMWKRELKLDGDVRYKSRTIAGSLAWLWEVILSVTAERLQGSGEVDPALAEFLDPQLKTLAKRLVDMERRVREKAALPGGSRNPP